LQTLIDEGYDPLDYRYFLLGGHYRSQLQFSWESLKGARNARKSLMEKVSVLAGKAGVCSNEIEGTAKDHLKAFNRAIEDDLSTPRALAEIWGLLKEGPQTSSALAAVFDMDKVLGLGLQSICSMEKPAEDIGLAREIEGLIAQRAQAKKMKDFAKADGIRQDLAERGIVLEDRPDGTRWRRM
jgi:cysteinyl-tRNA synthetase